MKIGSIEEVPIREVWPKEDEDFTPWLSENLHELEKALRFYPPITNVQTEVDAGRLSCDIVGNIGDETIIIENMFGTTDHSHLGQCIAYAAMLKADRIVFVAESFRDEHLTAIDWLNEQFKNGSARFYAVTISAGKIGDSEPAPLFDVLREPDIPQKAKDEERSSTETTARMANRQEFWTDFINVYGQIDPSWKNRTAAKDTWMSKMGGSSQFTVSFRGHSRSQHPNVALQFYTSSVEQNEQLFTKLEEQKESIEQKWKAISKEDLTWASPKHGNMKPTNQYREIYVEADLTINFKSSYEEERKRCSDWLVENLKRFEEVFTPFLKELK